MKTFIKFVLAAAITITRFASEALRAGARTSLSALTGRPERSGCVPWFSGAAAWCIAAVFERAKRGENAK
jgi:hypothetical protein